MKETFQLGGHASSGMSNELIGRPFGRRVCHVPGTEPRERAATPSTRDWRSENGRQDAQWSESALRRPCPPMSIDQDGHTGSDESERQDLGNWCRAVEGSLGRALLRRRADLRRRLGRGSLSGSALCRRRRASGSERNHRRKHGTEEKGHRRQQEDTSPNGAHQKPLYNQTSHHNRSPASALIPPVRLGVSSGQIEPSPRSNADPEWPEGVAARRWESPAPG
jgi:hypothetical protein